MGGQWPAGRCQHAGDSGLAEQAVEQVFPGEPGGASEKDVLRSQVHAVLSCPLRFSLTVR
jgi:hypothetical protein